jgi:hypothetical protein
VFDDAEIFHRDVDRAHPRDKGSDAGRVGEIGCAGAALAAAIDDDRRAPSARPRIIAKPIPDVDPVTAPRLPLRAIFMSP